MFRYKEEQLIRVMARIDKRINRRIQKMIDDQPIAAHDIICSRWYRKSEDNIIHFCRLSLMEYYPTLKPFQAKEKNKKVIEYARKNKISRSDARKMLDLNYKTGSRGSSMEANSSRLNRLSKRGKY